MQLVHIIILALRGCMSLPSTACFFDLQIQCDDIPSVMMKLNLFQFFFTASKEAEHFLSDELI